MTQAEKQKMMLTAPVEGLICRMAVPTIISMLIGMGAAVLIKL